MNKTSQRDIPINEQAAAWNVWNARVRGAWTGDENLNLTSRRQAEFVESAIAAAGRGDLDILEVGCGTGWLCQRLQRFGRVTATDLADEVLQAAARKWPAVRFVSGDFMTVDLGPGGFDVVVSLEVLSHVADQPAFVARLAGLLRPGGMLLLATQNRPVLERWSAIGGPAPGQIRRWVDAAELRQLLRPHFASVQIGSVVPVGDRGLLRLVNSPRLNHLAATLVPAHRIESLKERVMLGHTLVARALKQA